jgi:hypothetical protein
LGAIAICVGAIVLGFDPNRWDYGFDLPSGTRIHLHDFMGLALISFGTYVLWRAPPQD